MLLGAALVLGLLTHTGQAAHLRRLIANDQPLDVPNDSPSGGASVLYKDGMPHINDVHQGPYGGCWLSAVAAAYAHANPTHLKAIVYDNPDKKSKATVSLWDWTKPNQTALTWDIKKVDRSPKVLMADLFVAWPSVLWRAFRELANDSKDTPMPTDLQAGKPTWAFNAISGPGITCRKTDIDDPSVKDSLKRAKTHPTVVASLICSDLKADDVRCDHTRTHKLANGLRDDHAFTVVDSDGETVTLRDPRGNIDDAQVRHGAEEGYFDLSMSDFVKYMQLLYQVDPC